MCGIAGKISFSSSEITPLQIEKMCEAIRHRGPDDQGVYLSPERNVGLGHRRLSIIDLSPLGHQPMSYRNRYWIVFNGEIYNFAELKKDLEKEKYSFKSASDTEVILALYDKYGAECVRYLRGMFAFALYDQQEQILFCARDRLGKKPFKYYRDNNVFIFASELKAILTQPEYRREPDYTALHHYLTFQYVPAPRTGFKNIQKLEAAHYLLLNVKTGRLTTKRYWRLDYSKKLFLSEHEWEKRIMDKLTESVRLRMVADVPLGAFLSGGIDSSAVVALMAQNSLAPIKTFSIGFEEEKYNELPYARLIAEKFKTDHTEFIVKPRAIEVLPLLARHYEEPFADPSALPTYYVSKLTRQHVTVALNGDGGDENFGGYSSYQIFKMSLLYEKTGWLHPLLIQPALAAAAAAWPHDFLRKLDRLSHSLSERSERRFLHYMCHFNSMMKEELYTDDFQEKMKNVDSFELFADHVREAGVQNRMDQIFFADLATYLPDDLLVKVDIASMANSLEGRSPFLDHELLEMTAQMPDSLKLRGLRQKKYILKKALSGLIPQHILERPKQGFGVPVDNWFRGDLKSYVSHTLLAKKALARGIFRQEPLARLLQDHAASRANNGVRLWNLLMLELWWQEYFS